MSGYLDWFDAYCPICKKETPHGRNDECNEREEAVVWCLECGKTTKDKEYKNGLKELEKLKDPN